MSAEEVTGNKPKWWKGVIGFVLLLVVILGGAWALIRFENTQSIKDTQESMNATESPQVQCYTPTETLDFTTGNPRTDAILYTMIQDNAGNAEVATFLKSYKETGDLDTTNALWVAADQKVAEAGGDISVRVYLQMDLNGNLVPKEDDGTHYVPIVVQPAEGTEAQWDVAGIAKITDGKAEAVSHQIVVGVSGDALVIPVENGENSDEQEYGLVNVSPVC